MQVDYSQTSDISYTVQNLEVNIVIVSHIDFVFQEHHVAKADMPSRRQTFRKKLEIHFTVVLILIIKNANDAFLQLSA
jgi:hypothetical protein